MAAKYAFGPSPAPHHAKALAKENVQLTKATKLALRATYIPMAAACASVSVMIVVLTLGPILQGELWARTTVTVAALVLGVPTSISSWWLEKSTGVRGPYRAVVAPTVLNVAAFILASLSNAWPSP